MADDTGSPKTTISARVDERYLQRLKKIAEADDRTLSYMVDRAIRDFVEREEKKRAK